MTHSNEDLYSYRNEMARRQERAGAGGWILAAFGFVVLLIVALTLLGGITDDTTARDLTTPTAAEAN